MKKAAIFAAAVSLMMAACATGPAANSTGTVSVGKSAIVGINWYLLEVRNGNNVTKLDRAKLRAEGMEDVYSLRFDEADRVFGKAAPNTYRGPCTWGSGSALKLGALASTMMASLVSTGFEESAYYGYLGKVNSWGLTANNRLELYCADQSGQAVLVFGQ